MKNNKELRGVIYVRVSSDEQVKGTSLDDQEARCKKYCEDNNIEITAIFREEGASAKTTARKVLLEAMEFSRKNKGTVTTFIIFKVDRFARKTEDHFSVRRILSDYNITLMSASESIGNDPTEKLTETILAGFAEFDNSIRKMRCSNGMLARLKSGIWPWKPSVGYLCAGNKKQGLKKTLPDQPHPEAFPLLQRCLQGYAKGIYSQMDILQELTKNGFQRITGIRPTHQFVDQLFGKRLTFYAGYLENPWPQEEDDSDKLIRGQHQPMITEAEWLAIKQIRSGKKPGITHTSYNPKFPLRRIVRCGTCGNNLTASTSKGKYERFDYYHCYNKTCATRYKGVPKAEMESAFVELLKRVTPTPEFLQYFGEVVIDHWKEKTSVLIKDGEAYEQQLRELQTRRASIFDMRENGTYTNEQFKERMEDIDSRIATVKISISDTATDRFDIEEGITYAKESITRLSEQWLTLDVPLRAKFQKLVFPEGIAYKRTEGFGTPKLGCVFSINERYSYHRSDLVDFDNVFVNQLLKELEYLVWVLRGDYARE